MQTLLVNVRNPYRLVKELGVVAAGSVVAGLGSAVIAALFWPMFVAYLLWDVAFNSIPSPDGPAEIIRNTVWCFNVVAGIAAVLWPLALGMRRQNLRHLWRWLPLLPAYQCLVTIAAWCAVLELWRDPYAWAKTEHGLARSSRIR